MNRPRLIRGLRIAWSMWWGIVCVLLVVLWVHSYVSLDSISFYRGREAIQFASRNGRVFVFPFTLSTPHVIGCDVNSGSTDAETDLLISELRINRHDYQWVAPYWLLTAISGITAVLPWIRRRFSLRTLLIATTLIAVVLGLVVWSSS
jgi:hypothetical protein